MGSKLLAGLLAALLLMTLVASGVLYFLQYQQQRQVLASHQQAMALFESAQKETDPAAASLRLEEALRLWEEEVLPLAGQEEFVPVALYHSANLIFASQPEQACAYYQRLADHFPQHNFRREALLKIAEYKAESHPEEALKIYSEIADATLTTNQLAEVKLGMVMVEDPGGVQVPDDFYDALQEVVVTAPNSSAAAKARQRLNLINRYLIFQDMSPNRFRKIYSVKRGDVLLRIANEYNTTVYIIERMNNLSASMLQPNQRILVPTWDRVYGVVDKSDYRLSIYRESDNIFLLEYPVGIGEMEWKTRAGEYVISSKEIHPSWPDPRSGRVIKYGDPDYPLGERWMGLSPADNPNARTGLGIHGTNEPETVGTSSSMGCVRLTDEDVLEVFAVMRLRSRVVIQE